MFYPQIVFIVMRMDILILSLFVLLIRFSSLQLMISFLVTL